MNSSMRLILCTVALLCVGSPLAAQYANPLSLRPGQQIRLNGPAPMDPWVEGEVVDLRDGSTFAFIVDDDPRVIYTRSYADVDTIDVRRRLPRRSAYDGGIWGLYLGATAGAIAGPLVAKSFPQLGTGTAIAAFSSGGGLIGALTGAAAGAILAPGKWYRHVFQ